ncbi:MAG: prolipoprotein diacylglyceryl transferase [Thermoleophilia bacterium]|nr:prolipoprotein diacylglyceryl transferase [Thermoleophilia bacterium]
MHPVLATFTIGGFEVVLRAYSTFYVLAWIAAVALATVVAWRRGFSWWRALATFAAALLVGFAGARLLDTAVNWGYYAENLSRIYDTGFRGFALYGGLILALAAGALLARAFRLPLWSLADGTVPAFAAGIVLMRTGCFLNGCCFGTVTSLPWGVTYPAGSPAWAHHVLTGEISLLQMGVRSKPVHPTQLYEMIAAVAFCGLAVWLSRRRGRDGKSTMPTGLPFLVFALGFTLFRLGDHFLRVRLATISAPLWFYPLLYCLIGVGVAGLIFWRLRFGRPAAPSSKGDIDLDNR